ncbi:MAG: hypothetical protein FWF23_01840 [Alphaproteobacteria bacterium]|nr:hypothetical protein [Alphaproteobacteria bacterium]MCL2505994.1 hypothetical protein [Alphaproteobacteria bacterium]
MILNNINNSLSNIGKYLLDLTHPLFKPYFPYAFWFAFFFIAFVFSAGSDFAAFRGYFGDPDNYVYAAQAIDWIKGQGWYDTVQYRMNPPMGTNIHYSRLLTVLYSIDIFLLSLVMGEVNAVITVAIIYPLVVLALFLLALRKAASLMCGEWGNIVCFLVLFCPDVVSRLALGRLDHHGIVLALTILSFVCIAEMILRNDKKFALWAGFLAAFALALGLESLAIVCLFSLFLGILSVLKGGIFSKLGVVYSSSLFLSSVFFLAVSRPPQDWLTIDALSYSVLFVILMGAKAVCFGAVALPFVNSSLLRRISAGAVVSLVIAGGFFYAFPFLSSGPYGALPPELANIIFTNAAEAWPLFLHSRDTLMIVLFVIVSLLMISPALFFAVKDEDHKRRIIWSGLVLILAALFALVCFYQIRFMMYVSAFSLIGVAAIIKKDWLYGRTLFHKLRLTLFIILLPAYFVLSDSVFPDFKNDPALIYSKSEDKDKKCDHFALAEVLNRFKTPYTIINTMDTVSPVLFLTKHSILASPYHTNLTGNLDVHNFFTTEDENVAREIALKRNAKLVVICTAFGGYYVYQKTLPENADLKNTFIQRLIDGYIPSWLRKVEDKGLGGYLVLEIENGKWIMEN